MDCPGCFFNFYCWIKTPATAIEHGSSHAITSSPPISGSDQDT
jgi:hypothetical protein